MQSDLVPLNYSEEIARLQPDEIRLLFERALAQVRDEVSDNPYILEALRVLPVGGYRSAIGSFWNAVVDDLRNKIMHRSLDMFNSAMEFKQPIRVYDDFQNRVNDDQLIEGAYKIGVIGWEASKILKHAKETRHIFDGHPKSSEPTILKVLVMMEDSIKYVLNEPYPVQIVDVGDYVTNMDSQNFDRNFVAISNALSELPEIYKNELINRLFTAYIYPSASSVLRSNIEFVAPILWQVLPKDIKHQVVRRVDQVIAKADVECTKYSFEIVSLVGGNSYLSITAREYLLEPIVIKLKASLDAWHIENECVAALQPYAAQIPPGLVNNYVWAVTQTYVGKIGNSYQFARTDFYANSASAVIPSMFEAFDDNAADAFVRCIKQNVILQRRIRNPAKFDRLRSLGNIVLERISARHGERSFLSLLVDRNREPKFWNLLSTVKNS